MFIIYFVIICGRVDYTVIFLFSNIVLADPTAYEEEICGGSSTNLIICYNSVLLCSIQKFGGSNLSKDCYDDALKTAKERAEIVEKVIDLCIQDSENVPINE